LFYDTGIPGNANLKLADFGVWGKNRIISQNAHEIGCTDGHGRRTSGEAVAGRALRVGDNSRSEGGALLLERGLSSNRSAGIGTGAKPPVGRWLAARCELGTTRVPNAGPMKVSGGGKRPIGGLFLVPIRPEKLAEIGLYSEVIHNRGTAGGTVHFRWERVFWPGANR
jgi:hypothetical protein